ncbi:hypothetical protein GTGU_01112 [Trabulsiella guamensis ATCC 49490]|uniref:Uncharacterized protein n=1 Tax=Trabulsiella guamensis ATCC 49490 TaxID=1005994 RepID=A0A085AG28_9ENTR|nr:hypothetical protein [Trabulsiella guamensis]KFC09173.1 hypothetical protein GTGU_01112 [Trabulsiella guamensis ATCC 49490]
MTKPFTPLIYSELTVRHPDFIDLAEHADSATQCDYCRALNQALILLPKNEQVQIPLRGLLHDVVGFMAGELKAPRFCQA